MQSGPALSVVPMELSYASLAGDIVPPATRENVHLLQHAADYQVCVRNLRRSGIGDIIWGLVCCWMGYMALRFMSISLGLFGLGAILASVGMWLLINPSPIGVVIDGIVLLLLAAWNLLISAFIIYRSGRPNGLWIVIAISQVTWGIRHIKTYPRFATAAAMQPSVAAISWLRDLAKATLKAKAAKNTAIVQFTRRGWLAYERWKGQLLPEVGVFVMTSGSFGGKRDVLLASQDEAEILGQKKKMMSTRYKVTVRIRERTLKVQMPLDSLQKLREWLAMAEPAMASVASAQG
jgi:hypothetical protein